MRSGKMMVALAAALALGAACTGGGSFGLSSADNDPAALARAFQLQKAPEPGKPMNGTGRPLAFLVSTGQGKKLVAWDLAAGKQIWAVDANVTSRVVVGAGFVAAREGEAAIVARSLDDGRELWKKGIDGKAEFLGAAADGDKVYYVIKEPGSKPTWYVVALGGGGAELWRSAAPGTLGAPAARGGLVYIPFLSQWLTILDGATGKQLARIRQTDEELKFVRTTSDGVFYGSRGVFLLDDKSVTGTREGATYGTAKLPQEFVRGSYHFDAFNPVQAGYSAFDRNRFLWRAEANEGKLRFKDGLVVVFTFRFFFAFDAVTGELRWAHNHPKSDIVSVEHVGDAIVYVSLEGELGAIDAKTGARLAQQKLGMRITGATFDADGFMPKGEGAAPTDTVGALAAMVGDRDSRFQAVKLFAISALGGVQGQGASSALLKVILDEKTPPPVYQKAAEVLVARKDAEALPLYLEALAVRHDYLAGTRPRAVEVLARAIGAIGKPEGAAALIPHLEDPQTPLGTVKEIAEALGKCGNKDAIPALRSFLLAYRADPMFAADSAALNAVIGALLAVGGGAERELVAFVAEDPRTQAPVAEYARYALSQKAAQPPQEKEKEKEKEGQGAK
jgi:outer membrane protein assembly factor BamB